MTDETLAVAATTAAPETTAPVEPVQTSESTAPTAPAEPTEAAASPPAETAPETTASSEEDTGDDPTDEGKPKKSKGGFQNRIDKITREKYEAEIKAEQYRQELEQLRQPKTDPNAPAGERPKIEQFKTLEEYDAALLTYGKQLGREEARKETVQERQERETLATRATLAAREAAALQKNPDYFSVINPVAPVIMNNPVLKQFVVESDLGTEVAYHLAKNPGKLDEITRLTPFAAGRELLKLEERLKAAPPPKLVTKAPDPIKPVGANEKVTKSYEDMSMDEYTRKRKEERRKLKG